MAHIWSDDVTTGTTANGTWTLDGLVSSTLKLAYHHIDDGSIPWTYTGIDTMLIDAGGVFRTVTFGTIKTAKDDVATHTAMKTAIDLALVPDGVTVGVSYLAATDELRMVFSGAVIIGWGEPASTANLAFNEVGTSNTANLVTHDLSARYVDERPATLELEIAESGSTGVTSRGTDAHHFIPTSDFQVGGIELPISGATNTLTMLWSRINAPGIACPFDLQWELQFVNS